MTPESWLGTPGARDESSLGPEAAGPASCRFTGSSERTVGPDSIFSAERLAGLLTCILPFYLSEGRGGGPKSAWVCPLARVGRGWWRRGAAEPVPPEGWLRYPARRLETFDQLSPSQNLFLLFSHSILKVLKHQVLLFYIWNSTFCSLYTPTLMRWAGVEQRLWIGILCSISCAT